LFVSQQRSPSQLQRQQRLASGGEFPSPSGGGPAVLCVALQGNGRPVPDERSGGRAGLVPGWSVGRGLAPPASAEYRICPAPCGRRVWPWPGPADAWGGAPAIRWPSPPLRAPSGDFAPLAAPVSGAFDDRGSDDPLRRSQPPSRGRPTTEEAMTLCVARSPHPGGVRREEPMTLCAARSPRPGGVRRQRKR
jgi:hypothetical protein